MKGDGEREEVRVTVDGGEFYAFARAMKRSYTAAELGEVVMSVCNGRLTIETKRGGCVLACNDVPPLTARLSGGGLGRLVSLVHDARLSGPAEIVFKPKLGEVALLHAGVKAKFD